MTNYRWVAVIAAFFLAFPAQAQDDPLAPLPPQTVRPVERPAAPLLSDWRDILIAIDSGRWEQARLSIAAMDRRTEIAPYVMAELYLAPDSPRIAGAALADLVDEAPELPQASRLASLANERGSRTRALPGERRIVSLGSAPRRTRARSTGSPNVESLLQAMMPYVEADQPRPAEALYRQALAERRITGEEQAEIAHRVAWIYYIAADLQGARRIAAEGVAAGTGEWRAQNAWIRGLADYRLGDCNAAATSFRTAALGTRNRELAAAGHFWAGRAEQQCRRPQLVAERLRAAAVDAETFYGQLARARLGQDRRLPVKLARPDENGIARARRLPNVARAIQLAAYGYRGRAAELLRHQAQIGDPREHGALIEVARQLGLGDQYWLATNGPSGAVSNPADRYPAPNWQPDNGWRIDPKMAFAHIIKESDFRERVISPANAVGLMQVRPGTARDTARARGETVTVEQLKRPETNIDHGQAFIELVRRNPATQDQLLRVIAAYNAGPVPVARWASIPGEDPLLWMESLPYWETRFYIPAVLRNYFVYHAEAGSEPPALRDIVEGRVPRYPAF